ncbi:MAG: potassium channel protein [Planctomycetaceae bacterium]|nr:potassium channel protein [Planctomycetaceae bacterium]
MPVQFRRFLLIAGLLIGLVFSGTIAIHSLTGVDWLESCYLAMVTLTTVGSRDIGTTPASMLFVICYLFLGLSFFTYGASSLGQLILSTDFRKMLEQRRMRQKIARLRDHFIVCGLGRMGLSICDYLSARNQPFVIVDHNEERLQDVCDGKQWLYMLGDATADEVLLAAGIEQARGLATVLASDADNIYVVLSARMLSSSVQIVSRASGDAAVVKLQRAGATRVISPFSSGAVKMARFMLNPSVEDFIEVTDARGSELELADIHINAGSPYIGKRLAETDFRERGVMVIGIRRLTGERLLPPPGSATILEGDSLFAFGTATAVQEMIGQSARTA